MDFISKKIKDISYITIADIVGAGISAIFWFYVAFTLGPEIYGEISYFISIAGLISTLSLLGASNTIIVYTAKNVRIQSTIYLLALSIGTIASLIVFFIFYNFGASFLILGYIIFALIIAQVLGKKIFLKYSKYVLTQRILMVVLSIGLYHIIGEEGILIGIPLSFTPYLWEFIKTFRISEINFNLLNQKRNFIINSYLQSLSGALSGSLDKLIIAPLFGFAILGNYSLGLQFLSLLTLIPIAVSRYLVPQDSTGNENKKIKKIIILFSVIVSILGITIGPLVISTLFSKFSVAENVIRIVSISVIPSTISMTYQTKFIGMEKSRLVLFSSLCWTVSQIFGIIILGNLFGVEGIALSLVIGTTAAATYSFFANKKLINEKK